jgi:hypothetical protein
MIHVFHPDEGMTMTFKKSIKPPSPTPDDATPAISPKLSIDDLWEQMEERRMDKLIETLKKFTPSDAPTDSMPPSKSP